VKPVSESELRDVVAQMLDRNELEHDIRDLFAIASKLATLEAKLDIDQLENSERYQALLDDFYAIREEFNAAPSKDDYYSDATLEKIHALLDSTGN
jgi:ribosome assembly protein YihI (activator of Der GTPase)